jgi:helix-turn-helix protein
MEPAKRARAAPGERGEFGAIIRRARHAAGLTLAELGDQTGYSASQVSRYERGLAPLSDMAVLRRFATALAIPPQVFGMTAQPMPGKGGHNHVITATARRSLPGAPTVTGASRREDGDDPVRRRQLLANLGVTAAAAAGSTLNGAARAGESTAPGDLLIARVRDAMLGLGPSPRDCSLQQLQTDLTAALADFHACRYHHLANRLPRLITTGHALASADDQAANALLADTYTLVTRTLIKLDPDQQLGWMAADRATAMATACMNAAERGLLIQSASYSAAKRGDRAAMRELTDEAAAIAARLGGRTLLRDHGGGFSPATVELHRISAEYSLGEAGTALIAAQRIAPARLPTIERRARYFTDIAHAHGQLGHRPQCLNALLAAERQAPDEVHARPAVRTLVSGLLVSGRTTPELRGLAARCGLA